MQINSQTRIIDLTVGELATLIYNSVREAQGQSSDVEPVEWVYGIKGIATVFNCGLSKAQEIKNSGAIQKAIVQVGRKIMIDKKLAIEEAKKHQIHI